MTIYEHTTSLTASGGSISSTTLNIRGGLLRHLLVRPNNETTTFQVTMTNEKGVDVLDYGFHQCEINDWNMTVPVVGRYTIKIKNASSDDTFQLVACIEE